MPRLVGINHVALEVDDVDAAVAFYEQVFDGVRLRGRSGRAAFVDIGDQFIALSAGRTQPPDGHRHFGLVVDDKEATRTALRRAGIAVGDGPGLDFLDPWGNRIQIVEYGEVQFTKTGEILRGMRLGGLTKSERALGELRSKGLAGER